MAQYFYEKAEPLSQRALNILEKYLGKNHPNTKTCQQNYNDLLEKIVFSSNLKNRSLLMTHELTDSTLLPVFGN